MAGLFSFEFRVCQRVFNSFSDRITEVALVNNQFCPDSMFAVQYFRKEINDMIIKEQDIQSEELKHGSDNQDNGVNKRIGIAEGKFKVPEDSIIYDNEISESFGDI